MRNMSKHTDALEMIPSSTKTIHQNHPPAQPQPQSRPSSLPIRPRSLQQPLFSSTCSLQPAARGRPSIQRERRPAGESLSSPFPRCLPTEPSSASVSTWRYRGSFLHPDEGRDWEEQRFLLGLLKFLNPSLSWSFMFYPPPPRPPPQQTQSSGYSVLRWLSLSFPPSFVAGRDVM